MKTLIRTTVIFFIGILTSLVLDRVLDYPIYEYYWYDCAMIFLIASIFLSPRIFEEGNESGTGLYIIATFFISLLLGWIAYGIFYQIEKSKAETVYRVIEENGLMALTDSRSTGINGGGTFFLGIGSVGFSSSEDVYYYFYETSSRGAKLKRIRATSYRNNVYINEVGPNITPRVRYYELYYKDVDHTRLIDGDEPIFTGDDYIKIDVPKGTIIREFKLDTQ